MTTWMGRDVKFDLWNFCRGPSPVSFGSKVLSIAGIAVDVLLSLPNRVGIKTLVTFTTVEASLVPGSPSSHLTLCHKHLLWTSDTVVCSTPLGPNRLGCWSRFLQGSYVSLHGGWNVGSWRAILIFASIIHRKYTSPDSIAVTLGSKEAAIAALAVHLFIMFSESAAVQQLVAVSTLDAHLVIRSTKDDLLLGKIHCLLAARTLARHLGLWRCAGISSLRLLC